MSDPLVAGFGKACAPLNLDRVVLARELHEVAHEAAISAFKPIVNSGFDELELETRLWDLLVLVAESPEKGAGGQVDTSLVISWVQSNLKQPQEPVGLQSVKWLHTKAAKASSKETMTIISELDPDAPLRQALPISPLDKESDEIFFKYVFELVLAGDITVARNVAADSNNWLVRAVLDCAPELGKGLLCPQLLAAACRSVSKTPQIGLYERGFYGLLCGELSVVAPLCESWETLLVAHLLAGASLEAFELSLRSDHKLQIQQQDWNRKIALALIQGRIPELVDQLVAELVTSISTGKPANLIEQPSLGRVLLHVELVLGLSLEETLVQLYVEYLCQNAALLAPRLAVVPEYVRFVGPDAQARVYGRVLAQITDVEAQKEQLELATKYGLALDAALQQAIELNFELFNEQLASEDIDSDNTDADMRLVGVLHWLVLAQKWPEACRMLLRAYALFLQSGRRHGAELLATSISADYVQSHALDGVRMRVAKHAQLVDDLLQLQQYAQLATALASLERWKTSTSMTTVSASKLVGQAIDTVSNALGFGYGAEDKVTKEVRAKYIPLIVYELFAVLQDASKLSADYGSMALNFAVRIADERLKLYELFDARLMHALAQTSIS